MKIAIIQDSKVFLSQENFTYSMFQDYNIPTFVKSMKVRTDDFVLWLYHNYKSSWIEFIKYSASNGEVIGEGKFTIPAMRPKTVDVLEGRGKKILTIQRSDADVITSFDITNYPFVFIRGDACYAPSEVILTRKIKSHGRDYMFLSWEGGKLPCLKESSPALGRIPNTSALKRR
jgi:hypothetical protein